MWSHLLITDTATTPSIFGLIFSIGPEGMVSTYGHFISYKYGIPPNQKEEEYSVSDYST